MSALAPISPRAEATKASIAAVRLAADQVLATLRGAPGVRNAQLTWGERALGLSPADIAQGLQTLLAGSTATQLRVGTKQVDVVLRAAGAERLDLDRLADLVLPTAPLGLIGAVAALLLTDAAFAFVSLSLNVFWRPMAIAMIGGLAVATALTLIFLPALYAWATLTRARRKPNAMSYPAGAPASSSPAA